MTRSDLPSNPTRFEEGVAELLHLCGFAAEHITGDREAVDVIAFTSPKELDTRKLDKLSARTDRKASVSSSVTDAARRHPFAVRFSAGSHRHQASSTSP